MGEMVMSSTGAVTTGVVRVMMKIVVVRRAPAAPANMRMAGRRRTVVAVE